ncbi:hypothetical protein ABFY41_00760 [Acinetobacter haemolyticus]|uniref:hypothetical protein n=1 Tax=Acinetobacter haemolyticus TaxID=29430 RepID=UPI003D1DB37E
MDRKIGNRVYLALTRTERAGEEDFIQEAVKLAAKYQIGVVAHNDIQFIEKDDFYAHEARVCIADGYVLGDDKRPKNYSPEQYFKTGQQMSELFSDIPSAIENTYYVAQRCNVALQLGPISYQTSLSLMVIPLIPILSICLVKV